MGIMSFKATNQINGDRKGLANQNGNFPLLGQAMLSKINAHLRGRSISVVRELPKLEGGVRFPAPAPSYNVFKV